MTLGFFTSSRVNLPRSAPVVQNQNALRQGHDSLHHVFDQKDGDPARVDGPNQLDEAAGLRRVEAGHDLVEEEHSRAGRQCARQFQSLPVGQGQAMPM